jgi:serine/threonine protein phosphatase 1
MVPVHQSTGNARAHPEAATGTRTPEGTRVYAIGDIHGRSDLLRQLRGKIADDARAAKARRNVIVHVGDYVDRGPDSYGVVDMLIEEPLAGFESHHLKGNHEDLLVQFLDSGIHGESWMMNGARATLESYGVEWSDTAYGPDMLATARRKLGDLMPESHRRFFAGLEYHHREGDYLFVHAGVRPGIGLEDQNPFDLMWIRETFLESDADHGSVVVHGHSIRPEPVIRPNRIGIDTGAFRTGRLTALVLDADTRRFLST